MQRWLRYFYIIAAFVAWAYTPAYAQRVGMTITGIVYDSLTLQPLAYVTVINQTRNHGATTDENGSFKLSANPGDSILFTLLGHARKTKVVRSNEEAMIIFLREFALTLKPVTIYGTFTPHGADKWKSVIVMPSAFRNPAGPGSGYMVETFGPGVSLGGLITSMFKSEKERKKLNTVREKAKQSETYLSVIVSEETKSYFQKTFAMSEGDYNNFIESFNKVHPEAVYIESKEEIMKLMVIFKATTK
ncbi:MAG TPA: carboxypeptidase-like regulatory domain-containing protein [Chryseolinea sp.]|nr:carboxypeptidase-like regulatory domain-containing protein [Chryseolinea sp.]